MRSRSWIAIAAVVTLLVVIGVALITLRPRASDPQPPATFTFPPPSIDVPTVTPTTPPLPTPTPGPLLYTIRDGDTLFGIAIAHAITLDELIAANNLSDPNVIRPGDVLVIPGRTAPTPAPDPVTGEFPTAVPLPTTPPRDALPTPTPSGPPQVEIAAVLGAGNAQVEVVRIRNRGGAADMEGWSLSDAAGNRYTFPRLVLFGGGEVALYTRAGESGPATLYWGRAQPVWNTGELIVLRDAAGATVDTYIVP